MLGGQGVLCIASACCACIAGDASEWPGRRDSDHLLRMDAEPSMTTAIEAVQDGQSISQAARDHGVPTTTLYNRA